MWFPYKFPRLTLPFWPNDQEGHSRAVLWKVSIEADSTSRDMYVTSSSVLISRRVPAWELPKLHDDLW